MSRLSRLRTWNERLEDDVEDQKDQLNQQILDTYSQLEKYDSWEGLEAFIREEQRKEFVNIMNADGEHLVLARERAKVYAKLLQRKVDLEQDLERLRKERSELED